MNSPIPSDLGNECRKVAKILNSFIDPVVAKGPDKVIPADILQTCKGIAVLTVLKAGFLWSGRVGSGLVIARLPNGEWSAPSSIATAGVGFGGQIGGELTDFVIILNSVDAVKAFSHGGNVTLGGALSVAAGPFGRTAEASGTIANTAAIFSYSKSKGLFAGISIEGSVIVERKDANAKFYGGPVSAKELLSGAVAAPAAANILYRALVVRSTAPMPGASTAAGTLSGATSGSIRRPPPPPPQEKKGDIAEALYDFAGEQDGDLPFKKGDIITITTKTNDQNDWWEGVCNGRSGSFPANYTTLI
ncbi:DUF500-domain-containing protein [Ramicandelaber brevisporus]|nr:DUF500-domain-containing protein [Ramicandelaber brevisporus]